MVSFYEGSVLHYYTVTVISARSTKTSVVPSLLNLALLLVRLEGELHYCIVTNVDTCRVAVNQVNA